MKRLKTGWFEFSAATVPWLCVGVGCFDNPLQWISKRIYGRELRGRTTDEAASELAE